MPKTSGTTPNAIVRIRMYLHDYSAVVHLQKEKYLEVIGTPVRCLPRASSEVVNSGRVTRLPGKSLLVGSSRVNGIRFKRMDISASN
ncbi:hypothetical protein TIFTF001_026161 [Ficus carica]|uniref:Uncharacterized protein n=1 Tax=Ficus carica TaxID=3494 RepID=A0AA88IXN2_FICCA|nr:hypothetical protein TIFTF001_026161 [Ficus carica]